MLLRAEIERYQRAVFGHAVLAQGRGDQPRPLEVTERVGTGGTPMGRTRLPMTCSGVGVRHGNDQVGARLQRNVEQTEMLLMNGLKSTGDAAERDHPRHRSVQHGPPQRAASHRVALMSSSAPGAGPARLRSSGFRWCPLECADCGQSGTAFPPVSRAASRPRHALERIVGHSKEGLVIDHLSRLTRRHVGCGLMSKSPSWSSLDCAISDVARA